MPKRGGDDQDTLQSISSSPLISSTPPAPTPAREQARRTAIFEHYQERALDSGSTVMVIQRPEHAFLPETAELYGRGAEWEADVERELAVGHYGSLTGELTWS